VFGDDRITCHMRVDVIQVGMSMHRDGVGNSYWDFVLELFLVVL